jgi:hypothetical protein
MSASTKNCPKCNGLMTIGFIADRGSNISRFVAEWIEGEPEKVRYLGTSGSNLEVEGRRKLPISSFRCEDCGYLEAFAL